MFLALGLTLGIHFTLLMLVAIVLLLAVISLALTSLGFVIAWRMDSTQGFHAIMSVFLMPMWLLSGAFFPPPPLAPGMSWMPVGACRWSMQVNPLTYGVAALRRLMYAGRGRRAAAGRHAATGHVLDRHDRVCRRDVCAGLQDRRPADNGRFAMNRLGRKILALVWPACWRPCMARSSPCAQRPLGARSVVGPAIAGGHVGAEPGRPPLTDFALTDQAGKPFDSESLRGKVWVGSFFFTNCPAVCWRMNQTLAALATDRSRSATCATSASPAIPTTTRPRRWPNMPSISRPIRLAGRF